MSVKETMQLILSTIIIGLIWGSVLAVFQAITNIQVSGVVIGGTTGIFVGFLAPLLTKKMIGNNKDRKDDTK